jgi:tetratricopeptide (TPR) repeat protein
MSSAPSLATLLQEVHAACGSGDLARAESCCREALATYGPRADVLANLGSVLLMQGSTAAAIDALRQARTRMPDHPGILANLGLALLRSGITGDAAAVLDRAVALDPRQVDALNNLGLARSALGDVDAAANAFAAALSRAPGYTPALSNWCDMLVAHDRVGEALALVERVVAVRGEDAGAWYELGYLRVVSGALDGARDAFLRAAALEPSYAPTHHNLATLSLWSNALDASIGHFRRALALDRNYAEARFGLACALLKSRHADEGWEAFEARRAVHTDARAIDRVAVPRWDGGEMPGGTLLVAAEEGLGDVLQFARFLALARRRVGRVVVLSRGYWSPLARLIATAPGIDAVASGEASDVQADACCDLMSLPHLLGLGNAAFAVHEPYLSAAEDAVARWRARLGEGRGVGAAAPRVLDVGLCWSGNPRPGDPSATRINQRRSLPLARLAPLAGIEGVRFVSLQKDGIAPADRAALAIDDWSGELHDYADTAALVATLDLVVSVDTSVVHCAGALGRPVWMLDRFDNCWRWGTDSAAPGWYPGLRVFRQARFGDWDDPVLRLRDALREHAAAARSR